MSCSQTNTATVLTHPSSCMSAINRNCHAPMVICIIVHPAKLNKLILPIPEMLGSAPLPIPRPASLRFPPTDLETTRLRSVQSWYVPRDSH